MPGYGFWISLSLYLSGHNQTSANPEASARPHPATTATPLLCQAAQGRDSDMPETEEGKDGVAAGGYERPAPTPARPVSCTHLGMTEVIQPPQY